MGGPRERPQSHNAERVRGLAPLVLLPRRRQLGGRDGGEGRILRGQEARDRHERWQGLYLQASSIALFAI